MLLKVSEIAKKYNITKGAVYFWIEAGLPFEVVYDVGAKAYKVIDEKEVEKFLDKRRELHDKKEE